MSSFASLPVAPPPPGIISNFIDPPTRVPVIIGLEAVFLTLMLLTVAMRIYVRMRVTKIWGFEDCKQSEATKIETLNTDLE